ncbi:MAG: hypothetical protein CMP11_03650 [Zetaproteobacteria bacterium]|nr:hypothetical protein [Pseudobdellovibrionaceae bacterium]|tara:strand:- start:600 stop:1340 length:741 start_codon:yes stop_codon:yes gene_type:complete
MLWSVFFYISASLIQNWFIEMSKNLFIIFIFLCVSLFSFISADSKTILDNHVFKYNQPAGFLEKNQSQFGVEVTKEDMIDKILQAASVSEGVPFPLLKAISYVESGSNPQSFSPNDGGYGNHAFGMCQVLRSTGETILRTKLPKCHVNFRKQSGQRIKRNCILFDPWTNSLIAAKYLRDLLIRYDGHIDKAIAAYNGGKARYKKENKDSLSFSGKVREFRNQDYVNKVRKQLPDSFPKIFYIFAAK